jgi:hypothetical protein
MGHFELAGFPLFRGVDSHEGLDYKFLSNYNRVFSGHYHTFSEHDGITYVGTPYELFWSDYQDQKKFGILDTDKMKIEYVNNPNKMFHKIHYDDNSIKIEDLKTIDFSKYANAYVKVVVLNKQDPYLFEKLIDEIYKFGPVDVTIVEDFTASNEETDSDIQYLSVGRASGWYWYQPVLVLEYWAVRDSIWYIHPLYDRCSIEALEY